MEGAILAVGIGNFYIFDELGHMEVRSQLSRVAWGTTRINEVKTIIERMDKRWDHGFIIDEETYVQKRIQLQLELEQLSPVADDELQQAADILTNFKLHWERLEGDEEARHELVKLIVERVYVRDKQVVAMTLRSNYHLVLNHNTNGPTEFTVDPQSYTDGSDGGRGPCV